MALYLSGQEAEADGTAERVVILARQKLPTAKSPRWMRFDAAVGSRILNKVEDANRQLHELLTMAGFPDPVLGPKDPALDFFKNDHAFQSMMADLNRQNELKRARVLEIERSFSP